MKTPVFHRRRSVVFQWLLSYISILIIPLILSMAVYVISSRALEREINRTNAAMLRQVQSDIDTRMLDMRRLAMQIGWNPRVKMLAADQTDNYPADEYNWIMRDFRVYRMSNSYIDDFYVFLKDKSAALTPSTLLSGELYENALSRYHTSDDTGINELLWEKRTGSFFPMSETKRDGTQKKLISYVQSLPVENTRPINATLLILLDSERLLGSIQNMRWLDRAVVLVLDQNDNILASTVPFTLPDELRYSNLGDEKLFYYTSESDGSQEKYTVANVTSAITGWKYVSITPNDIFWKKTNEVRGVTVLFVTLSLLLGLVLSGVFVSRNYIPVRKLVGELSGKGGGRFDPNRNEFGFITETISSTLGARREKDRVLDRQLAHLRDSFIARLLKNNFESLSLLQEALTLYDLHFSSGRFAVMVFYIKDIDDTAFGGMADAEQLRVARYSARNVFEELLGRYHYSIIVKVDDLQAALINVSESRPDPAADFAAAADEGSRFLKYRFGVTLGITISTVKEGLEHIPEAYSEAYTTMEYNILRGTTALTSYSDISLGIQESNRTYYYYYPLQVEVQFTNFIKSGDYNSAKKILSNLFEINFNQYSLPSLITKCFMYNLVSTIMKTIYEITGSSHSELVGTNAVETLLGCQSVTEMDMELNKILISLCEYTRARNAESELSRSAIDYVEHAFSDDTLSIPQISEALGITPSYLSKRFKENTGTGLLDYISKRRIDEAKRLLTQGESPIQQIAETCGFVNSNTFIRTFKKYEGVTPGKFREITPKNADDR